MFHVEPITIIAIIAAVAFAFGWSDACRQWRKSVEDLGRELEQQRASLAEASRTIEMLQQQLGAYWQAGYAQGEVNGHAAAFREMERVVSERGGVEITEADVEVAKKMFLH